MPNQPFSSAKSVSTRLQLRSRDSARSTRPMRKFSRPSRPCVRAPQIPVKQIQPQSASGSQQQQRRTISWSPQRRTPIFARAHGSADSTKSYAHGAAPTSSVAQTLPRRRLQNHPPPHAALSRRIALSHRTQLRLFRFSLLPRQSLRPAVTPDERRHAPTPLPVVGAPRWPKASAWAAGRPQRSEDDHRSSTFRARGTRIH